MTFYDKVFNDFMNQNRAAYWLVKCVRVGSTEAMHELGLIFYSSEKYANDAAAFYCFQCAANNYHVDSIYHLGLMYENGRAGERDIKKAFELFYDAAKKGHKHAQYIVGVDCQMKGDLKQAIHWFNESGEVGVDLAKKIACILGEYIDSLKNKET